MKSIHYIAICTGLLIASCKGGGQAEDGIHINGTIQGAEGERVTLWLLDGDRPQVIDSATVTDGAFALQTTTRLLRFYAVEVGAERNMVYLLPDESASAIQLGGTYPEWTTNYTVSGDQNSMDYRDYQRFAQPHNERQQALLERYPTASATVQSDLIRQMDSIAAIVRAYAIRYIDKKPSSPVSWLLLQAFYPPSGLAHFDTTDLAYFEKVGAALERHYPYSEYPELIARTIETTRAQIYQLQAVPNGTAPDLMAENPEGTPMKLSSLRGKVVLLDFWASWCRPCRMENPEIVNLYNTYKSKGFTVFSVSLDTDKRAWKNAIEADQLNWPHHVSDLKGWQSKAAALYGVNAIPTTFLIDREGAIVSQNLRGGQLEQKLIKLLE